MLESAKRPRGCALVLLLVASAGAVTQAASDATKGRLPLNMVPHGPVDQLSHPSVDAALRAEVRDASSAKLTSSGPASDKNSVDISSSRPLRPGALLGLRSEHSMALHAAAMPGFVDQLKAKPAATNAHGEGEDVNSASAPLRSPLQHPKKPKNAHSEHLKEMTTTTAAGAAAGAAVGPTDEMMDGSGAHDGHRQLWAPDSTRRAGKKDRATKVTAHDMENFKAATKVAAQQAVHRAQHESAARAAVLLPFSSRRLAESNVVDHTDTNEALQLVQPDQLGEQQQGMAPVAPAAKHMPLAPRGPRLGGPLAMAQGLHIHTGVGNGLRAQARPLAMPNAEAAMRGALSTERLDQQEAVGKRALQAMPKTRDHPEVNDQKGPPPPHQDHSQLDGQKGPPPPPPPHSGSEAHGSGGHGGGGDGGSGSGNPHGPPPPPPAAPDQGVAATSNSDTTSEEAEAVRAAAVALADALKAYQAAHGESLVAELVAPGGALAALVTEFSDGSSTSIASASGLFLHEDWSNAVAADQSACAADFKSLCGGQEEEEAGSMPPHHDGEAPHWFRRALLQDDHHGHGHDDKHDKPHDDHHHDDMHEKSHDDHHHGPDGHHGPDDHSKQDGSHDGSQDARHGPLGFGSREADQCLRTHLTSTSPPCRAAVARTDSIYLYLSQSGDAPRPPPHHPPSHDDLDDDEVNGAHGEGHPPPPHARWTNGLLVLALLVSCVLARRRRLSVRQARAKVAQALQTLDSHPALKLALEDAAGVTLPSPQWKFKVHAVLAANPRLQQALLEAEADDHSALSGGANHHRHPDGEHLQLVDVNEHGQQLDSATVRHHHGAGGDVGGPPHFDPFHGGPITHPRQRACGRRGAPCVKRAVAIVLLLVLVAMAFHASMHGPGGGGDEGVWDTSSEEGGGSSGSDDVHNDAPNDPPSENEGTDDERPPPPTSLGSLGLVLGAAFLAVCVLRTCRRFRCTQEPNHNELAVAVPTEDAEQGEVVVLSKEDAKAAAAGYPSGSSSSSKNGAVPVLPSNSVVVISAQVVSK